MWGVNESGSLQQPKQTAALKGDSSVGTSRGGGRVTGENHTFVRKEGYRFGIAMPKYVGSPTRRQGQVGSSLPVKFIPGMGIPRRKLVVNRLTCKFLPLQDSYIKNGCIIDDEADVVFMCADGGRIKGHRVILACMSTFFSRAFSEQRSDEITYVSVPWIQSDIMKLIVVMAYKKNVILTSDQMESVKSCGRQFGIRIDGLQEESVDDEVELDALPGTVLNVMPTSNPLLLSSVTGAVGGDERSSQQSQPNALADSGQRHDFPPSSEDESDSYHYVELSVQRGKQCTVNQRHPNVKVELDDLGEDDGQCNPIQAESNRKELVTEAVCKEDVHSPTVISMDMVDTDQQNLGCKFCSASLVGEKSWKWHKERHIGVDIFKCSRCDKLFKTSRAVWSHELSAHNLAGISVKGLEERNSICTPSNLMGKGTSSKRKMQQSSRNRLRPRSSGGGQLGMDKRSSSAIENSSSKHVAGRKKEKLNLPARPSTGHLAHQAAVVTKRHVKAEKKDSKQGPFRKVPVTKRKPSAIDFPRLNCPICGANSLTNISLHLAKDHTDLNFTCIRISANMLRCKKCVDTFAVGDLLAHVKTCSSAKD